MPGDSPPHLFTPEQEYLDYRVRRFFRRTERRGLVAGALLSAGVCFMMGPLAYFELGLEGLVLPAVASVVVMFALWSLSVVTAGATMDFLQELNRERDRAVARS